MKKRKLLAMGLSMAMLLSACGGSSTGQASSAAESTTQAAQSNTEESAAEAKTDTSGEKKDTLVCAGGTEPSSLDPHNLNMVTGFMMDYQIFDRLFVSTVDNEIVPQLAESWEWVDDTTLRVKIHEGVTFSDGTPLTADDVVYSIQRACENSASAATFANFDGSNTVKVDDYTVDIKTKTIYPNALTILTHGRGSIVSKAAIEEMGEDAYGRAPIGSGRLIVKEWVSGDRIEFVRNDNYWDKDAMPQYQYLTFRFISEASSRTIELESGGVDLAFNIPATDWSRLEANPDVEILTGPGATVNQFVINIVNFDTLKDAKVREAMHKALNMEAIVKTAYQGSAEVADSIFPKGTFGYVAVGPETYDPEGAKKLLEESGFDTSQPIVINLYKDSTAQAVCEMAANMWKDIGLNVSIEILDRATMVTNNAAGQTFMCLTTNTTSAGNPENLLLQWEKDSTGYTDDADLVARIGAAKQITDEDERRAAYEELQKEIWAVHNVIPVSVNQVTYCYRSNVKGVECHASNSPDLSKIYFE
ncbi:MAG: ABC transporter substrate-binding protein [Clostridiales bacterium]|nr:ABC transporter substrate-binding protein [Clostridiales bacterium]